MITIVPLWGQALSEFLSFLGCCGVFISIFALKITSSRFVSICSLVGIVMSLLLAVGAAWLPFILDIFGAF